MNDEKNPQDDPAVAAELKGVPEDLLDKGDREGGGFEALGGELGRLREDREAATQAVLYPKAAPHNVRPKTIEKPKIPARINTVESWSVHMRAAEAGKISSDAIITTPTAGRPITTATATRAIKRKSNA